MEYSQYSLPAPPCLCVTCISDETQMCMISRFRQIWVSSKVNDLSGQINGATGNTSGTHTGA
eukprot:3068842-Pleurochrysis_carterae.AAC.1